MLSTHVLFLISLLAISASEACVKYDFEEDFTAQFGFSEICENMVAARWYRGLYSWGVPASPHVQSRSFISPTASRISCTSSFPFEIQAGGLLEVNVHMQPTNDRDQISVMVYRKAATGLDQLVSSVISSRLSPNFKLGQNTLNITFPGTTETFEGYVIFLGLASTSSIILVDSFRYIPPNTLESSCVIYEEGTTASPTAIPTTSQTSISDTSTSGTSTSATSISDTSTSDTSTSDTSTSDTSTSVTSTSETESTTTGSSETELTTTIAPDHACKTYEFGENFNTEFGNIGCNFLSSWELITNIPADVEKFHSESNSYISASSNLPSCTTSYTFPMRSDGYLEVNSYMGADDRIHITVYESTTEGLIKTINQKEFTGIDYKNWQSLKIPLYIDDQADDNTTFTFIGYIQITGSSSTNSPILVDSFRYYAPETENECQIYQESTTCKTYTFGSSFDNDFLNTGCTFLAKWKLVEEIPHDVVKFNTRSTSYIQAEENFPSCTTSYSFPMRTDGYLEVNSYMEAAGDMIHVTVYESASDGLFKIINEVQFNGSAHSSWNELRIPLTSTSDSYQSDDAIGNLFTGYITIIGSATSQSKVLVDSFRYYAPETESECQIYQDSTTCKIYQFGERFVTDFDQTGCLVLPEWTVVNNQYIIADKIFPSCTTSYNFRMRTDGYLEFKAQIDAGGLLHVTVYANLNDGLHRIITEKEFVDAASDWTLLRVSLNPTEDDDEGSGEENEDEDLEDEDDDAVEIVHSTFMGYITIVGSRASVEAFRYFAPEVEEQCQIPTGSTDASQPNLLSILHQVMSQPLRSSYQDV